MKNLIPFFLFFVFALTSDAQTFTKITNGDIANDGGDSRGAVWVDIDGDDRLDLYISNVSNEANGLYTNNGDGTFTTNTTSPISSFSSSNGSSSFGDYDNDGNIDVFIAHLSTNNLLFKGASMFNFTQITSGEIVTDGGISVGATWADYDNDGHLDAYMGNYNGGVNFLYKNDGNGGFIGIDTGIVSTDAVDAFGVTWIDYDNDGDDDLFVASLTEENRLYRNEGGGYFIRITSGAIVTDDEASRTASWGDFDNDGDFDVFVGNFSGDNNSLYNNNGNGTFTKVSSGPMVSDGGWTLSSCWEDLDNDGDLDLFVANGEITQSQNQNFYYSNDGDGAFTKVTVGDFVTDNHDSQGVSAGDYDKDGFLDLAVINRSGQDNYLYHNNGNGNNWVNLDLVGLVSNRSAIGAKVRLKATLNSVPVWQLREVQSKTGYRSQNSLNVEFGLKDANVIDSLEIHWPSGLVCTYTNMPVNEFYTFYETCFDPSGPCTVFDTTNVTVYDTISTEVFDTTYVTINDTELISVTDTLYIDVINSAPKGGFTNTIRVYPNPASTHLYIDNGDYQDMNGYSIEIYNSLAQLVFSSPINQQQFYIDLSTWSGSGSYVVNILDPNSAVVETSVIILQ